MGPPAYLEKDAAGASRPASDPRRGCSGQRPARLPWAVSGGQEQGSAASVPEEEERSLTRRINDDG